MRIRPVVLYVIIAMTSSTALAEKEFFWFPKAFLGAAAVIGPTEPDFSFGMGARGHYYPHPEPGRAKFGTFGEVEWNRRGGSWGDAWDLHYIDINFGPMIEKDAFFGSGLSLGINTSNGSPEDVNAIDLGGIVTFGYIFPSNPRIVVGFDLKVGFFRIYDSDLAGNNITWGLTLGLAL